MFDENNAFVPFMFHLLFVPLSLLVAHVLSHSFMSLSQIHNLSCPFSFSHSCPLSLCFCHSYTCTHSYLCPRQTHRHQVSTSIPPWHLHTHTLSHTLVRHCDSSLAQWSSLQAALDPLLGLCRVIVRGNHPLHTHTSKVCSPVVVFMFLLFLVSFVRSLFPPLTPK